MRENDVMNHDRALIMVVLFVIHRPAASAVARPPSTTVAPSSAAPSSLNARIRLRGAALVAPTSLTSDGRDGDAGGRATASVYMSTSATRLWAGEDGHFPNRRPVTFLDANVISTFG